MGGPLQECVLAALWADDEYWSISLGSSSLGEIDKARRNTNENTQALTSLTAIPVTV